MSPATTNKILTTIHKAYSLHQQGKIDKAEKLYRKALKQDPRNFDALQGMGAIALHKKLYKPAISFLESAISINPGEPGLLTNLGLAFKYTGKKTQAREFFKKSISLDDTFGPAHYNMALLEIDENNFEQALHNLYESEKCRPGHIPTLTSIAYTLTRLGLVSKAIKYFRHAVQLDPDNANLHFEAGKSYQSNRQDQEAIDELSKAIAINPKFHDARAKLADIYESTNCTDEAFTEAEIVLSNNPEHLLANLVIAKIERRQGKLEQARNRLQAISEDIENEKYKDDICAGILTELGIVQDRLMKYDDAFNSFTRANHIMENLPLSKSIDPQQAYHVVDACNTWLKNQGENKIEKGKIENDDLPSPIFLVGFPRSGTTLTEQILAAHEYITTGDELPVLHHIALNTTQILGRNVDYPNCLDELTDDDIHLLRQYYWNQITSVLGKKVRDQLFIDKMPLNIIHLGLIDRLFPESKIIVALRDPRDVCLSCYMQLFLVNESMLQFLDITNTARYYTAVMGLWLQYKEMLENNYLRFEWIESRYEDIITDLDQASARLYTFLGIDQGKAAGEFHQQASTRTISTPSYQDVSTPIYKRAMGRWQHYQNHLVPVIDELAPFVKTFGYKPAV